MIFIDVIQFSLRLVSDYLQMLLYFRWYKSIMKLIYHTFPLLYISDLDSSWLVIVIIGFRSSKVVLLQLSLINDWRKKKLWIDSIGGNLESQVER